MKFYILHNLILCRVKFCQPTHPLGERLLLFVLLICLADDFHEARPLVTGVCASVCCRVQGDKSRVGLARSERRGHAPREQYLTLLRDAKRKSSTHDSAL